MLDNVPECNCVEPLRRIKIAQRAFDKPARSCFGHRQTCILACGRVNADAFPTPISCLHDECPVTCSDIKQRTWRIKQRLRKILQPLLWRIFSLGRSKTLPLAPCTCAAGV